MQLAFEAVQIFGWLGTPVVLFPANQSWLVANIQALFFQ